MTITPDQMIAAIKKIDGVPFNYGRIQRRGFQCWQAKLDQLCAEFPCDTRDNVWGLLEDMLDAKMVQKYWHGEDAAYTVSIYA